MKYSGSSHLMTLIDSTKVYGDSDFDKIKNKARRREAKEQTQLRDDKDTKKYYEELFLIKKMKQSKKSDIEARVKYAFTYVKSYIKKDDGRTDTKVLRNRYENVPIQEKYVSETKRTIDIIQYRNERAMNFKTFVSKLVKTVEEIEKLGRGMHNDDIVEIIYKRVRNAELSQYLTFLKVQFQHKHQNYREVLKYIAIQVPSIGVDTFQKAY